MKTLFFDIETIPCMAWVWGPGKQYVTSDQVLEPSRIICISYAWDTDAKATTLCWSKTQDDKAMLKAFAPIAKSADVLVGHNGERFDLTHISARMAYHGLDPLSITMIEDTLKMTRRSLRLPGYSLKALTKYFDLPGKISTGGMDLWLKVWLGNDKKALSLMGKYCANDVLILRNLWHRILPYIKTKHSHAAIHGDPNMCPSCGSKDIRKDGIITTSTIGVRQRMKCSGCGKNFRTGANLLENSKEYMR